MQSAFRKLSAEHAYFSESEVLRETAIRSQSEGVSVAKVRSVTDQFLTRDQSVHALSKTCFTSTKNMQIEAALLQTANRLSARNAHQIKLDSLESRLIQTTGHSEDQLNWEQSTAVSHVTIGKGAIAIVNGKAGTGKTRMLRTAAELWKDAGYQVFGACVSGKAARGLHEATGIQTETVAKLLFDSNRSVVTATNYHFRQLLKAAQGKKTFQYQPAFHLDAKSILVLDEAAMIGTQDLQQLLSEVERAKAKVVLVGDGAQLQPIAPGNPFQSLVNRLGAVQLDEIQRQRNSFDRKMVSDLSVGNIQDALTNLAERDLVHIAEDRSAAIQQLVTDWGATGHSDNLILVPSRKEVADVNLRCQQLRQKRGEVKNGVGLKVGQQTIHVGDRIQFGRRDRLRNLENGDFATVEKVNRNQQSLTVRLDSGRKALVPLKQYDAVNLGYATTVHKGQGLTVDRAFVLLGGYLQDQHLSYVQLSRAREETRVYVDRYEVGQNYSGLISLMERDRQRTLAHDQAQNQTH